MRRITLWLMSTISALVLLFSYPTSTSAKTKTAVEAEAPLTESASGSSDATSSDSTAGSSSADNSTNGTAGQGDSPASEASTPSSSSSSSSASSSGSGSSSNAAKTYTGDEVMTRWGLVQVQITVANGKITKSGVTQIPWDNPRDQQINSYAVPVLNDEVITAQSASIDMVSGATVTSNGYIQSLQSAIDQAHL
ncbi:FMN-binding protein [Nostocoides vanveenii]|jgi:uncharacterized protein with FMN-binding domain|uniref:FMN-binding protein n=1 Tax=Nostocoides vanveenii TaxID=330835 RepID=A0ABN2K5Z3_9MICO